MRYISLAVVISVLVSGTLGAQGSGEYQCEAFVWFWVPEPDGNGAKAFGTMVTYRRTIENKDDLPNDLKDWARSVQRSLGFNPETDPGNRLEGDLGPNSGNTGGICYTSRAPVSWIKEQRDQLAKFYREWSDGHPNFYYVRTPRGYEWQVELSVPARESRGCGALNEQLIKAGSQAAIIC